MIEHKNPMFPMDQQTVWAIFHGSVGSFQHSPGAGLAGRPGLVQSAAAIFDVRLQAGRTGP